MNIEIVSGSTRRESITLRAAKYLQAHLTGGVPQHNVGLIDLREIRLPYMEKVFSTPEAAPLEIRPLAKRMHEADAFIIVSPEYNGTMSPGLINWFNHFPKQLHKAFGLVTASDGAMGGIRTAMDLQHFALALFGVPVAQMLVIGEVHKKFDENGHLIAPSFQPHIDRFVSEFLWLAEKLQG